MTFQPDCKHIVDVANNVRPARLPIYEHGVHPVTMGRIIGEDLVLSDGNFKTYYERFCRFYQEMTYDAVSFEAGICGLMPGHGAIFGGRIGPIQSRADFEAYPFDSFVDTFFNYWRPHLDALAEVMPPGMRVLGGCGNGVFEISEDLLGYECLCVLQYDDPELFGDLYRKIGDMMLVLWGKLLEHYGDLFCVCRMGDDLGFKTQTLLAPDTIREHVIPQYRRIIDLVKSAGKPFLLHSCGNIFSVMDDLIAAGIQAKHSNEDQNAPFGEWIARYGDRIGFFGGIDVDVLVRNTPDAVFEETVRRGTEFRNAARGYALGSGNSIPDYVPVENYLAMIEGAKEIRRREEAEPQ